MKYAVVEMQSLVTAVLAAGHQGQEYIVTDSTVKYTSDMAAGYTVAEVPVNADDCVAEMPGAVAVPEVMAVPGAAAQNSAQALIQHLHQQPDPSEDGIVVVTLLLVESPPALPFQDGFA